MGQEATERRILSFCPQKGFSCDGGTSLNNLAGTPFEVVYKVLPYQLRVTTLPDEPFTPEWTRQPVLALVEIGQREGRVVEKYKTLAYATDIRSLPEGVAEKLAAHLENWNSLRRQITGEWEV